MDSLWGNIFRAVKKKDDVVTAILREVPLFADLKSGELARVRELMHVRNFRPEEVIFSQGVPGFGMYIIETGSVRIVHEDTGRTLAELVDGDFFGELALLAASPRSAMAVASAPSRLYGFFHSDLASLIEHNPRMGVKISMKLASIIGQRLISSNEQVEALQEKLDEMVKAYERG